MRKNTLIGVAMVAIAAAGLAALPASASSSSGSATAGEYAPVCLPAAVKGVAHCGAIQLLNPAANWQGAVARAGSDAGQRPGGGGGSTTPSGYYAVGRLVTVAGAGEQPPADRCGPINSNSATLVLPVFRATSTILPTLSDDGRVIPVGGDTPGEASAPDDQSVRLALLDVLAHAIQADKSTTRIRIRRLPNTESAEQIATVALGGEPTREEALADLQAREPKVSFDDLRIEVMGLFNGQF